MYRISFNNDLTFAQFRVFPSAIATFFVLLKNWKLEIPSRRYTTKYTLHNCTAYRRKNILLRVPTTSAVVARLYTGAFSFYYEIMVIIVFPYSICNNFYPFDFHSIVFFSFFYPEIQYNVIYIYRWERSRIIYCISTNARGEHRCSIFFSTSSLLRAYL